MKTIAIIGSTGSIGTQTLDVVRQHPTMFKVVALAGNSNVAVLNNQVAEFNPEYIGITRANLQSDIKPGKGTIYAGEDALLQMITEVSCDIVVMAISGAAGLKPAIATIQSGKNLALATKEVMVLAGDCINQLVQQKNAELAREGKSGIDLFPIDSEHSAIWQSLRAGTYEEIEKIILTCSGGPFRGKTRQELETVTLEQALHHPNWNMGKRITIDSATLMNKGLEVIEAKWLFQVSPEAIEVVIHPQSILHSAVQFRDGSIIGQMGAPDMRLPIQYALTHPNRPANTFSRLSLPHVGTLTFSSPDTEAFPCLSYAYEAIKQGGTMPAILNAADEVAVDLFLKGMIRFCDITQIIESTMSHHTIIKHPQIEDILEADAWARRQAGSLH